MHMQRKSGDWHRLALVYEFRETLNKKSVTIYPSSTAGVNQFLDVSLAVTRKELGEASSKWLLRCAPSSRGR